MLPVFVSLRPIRIFRTKRLKRRFSIFAQRNTCVMYVRVCTADHQPASQSNLIGDPGLLSAGPQRAESREPLCGPLSLHSLRPNPNPNPNHQIKCTILHCDASRNIMEKNSQHQAASYSAHSASLATQSLEAFS